MTRLFDEFIENKCYGYLRELGQSDAAHDLLHIKRVVKTSKKLALTEKADFNILIPAACLHDCVLVPKNSPNRNKASEMAANQAVGFLSAINYPRQFLDAIHHAIVTHSYSAGLEPKTIEAKVLQDADRLDAVGAIGIARCFSVGGKLDRALYSGLDPFCEGREPDDASFTIDHFYAKLLKLPDSMQTESGREEAKKRIAFMQDFLQVLKTEIS